MEFDMSYLRFSSSSVLSLYSYPLVLFALLTYPFSRLLISSFSFFVLCPPLCLSCPFMCSTLFLFYCSSDLSFPTQFWLLLSAHPFTLPSPPLSFVQLLPSPIPLLLDFFLSTVVISPLNISLFSLYSLSPLSVLSEFDFLVLHIEMY